MKMTNWRPELLIVSAIFAFVNATLDFDELENVLYSIDILSEPIVLQKDATGDEPTIILSASGEEELLSGGDSSSGILSSQSRHGDSVSTESRSDAVQKETLTESLHSKVASEGRKEGLEKIYDSKVVSSESNSNGIDVTKNFQKVGGNEMKVYNKFGQPYSCSLPTASLQFDNMEQERERIALRAGVVELLQPLGQGCLYKVKGWWTYELCYGKFVKQYHMEEGKVSGQKIVLGYYHSQFDWQDGAEGDGSEAYGNGKQEEEAENRLKRFHSQKYMNGSQCDLTGQPRQVEVRFMCEEGKNDYIYRIEERVSCAYVMTVHTTRICHHPYLKPVKAPKPRDIHCQLLLEDDAQWHAYQHQKVQQLEKARQEEAEMIVNTERGRLQAESAELQKLLLAFLAASIQSIRKVKDEKRFASDRKTYKDVMLAGSKGKDGEIAEEDDVAMPGEGIIGYEIVNDEKEPSALLEEVHKLVQKMNKAEHATRRGEDVADAKKVVEKDDPKTPLQDGAEDGTGSSVEPQEVEEQENAVDEHDKEEVEEASSDTGTSIRDKVISSLKKSAEIDVDDDDGGNDDEEKEDDDEDSEDDVPEPDGQGKMEESSSSEDVNGRQLDPVAIEKLYAKSFRNLGDQLISKLKNSAELESSNAKIEVKIMDLTQSDDQGKQEGKRQPVFITLISEADGRNQDEMKRQDVLERKYNYQRSTSKRSQSKEGT